MYFNLPWQFYYNIQKITLNCILIDLLQDKGKKNITKYFIIANKETKPPWQFSDFIYALD